MMIDWSGALCGENDRNDGSRNLTFGLTCPPHLNENTALLFNYNFINGEPRRLPEVVYGGRGMVAGNPGREPLNP
jgi:hypothetical protein